MTLSPLVPTNSHGDESLAIDRCRAGDIVLDRELTPIGTINAVIRPPSGIRLIVAVAGYHDRYVVVPTADLAGTFEPPFGPANRHVVSGLRLPILDGPTYRREMGRLVRDLTRIDPFAFPPNQDWGDADDLSRTTVQDGLALARLTAGEPVGVDAWHGAIHLHGRVATDAGAIEAMRVAHGAPGVWHVVSSLISDEALGMHLRRQIRGSDAAAAVAAISVMHGRGIVTPFHDDSVDPMTLAAWHARTPGLDSLSVGPSRPR